MQDQTKYLRYPTDYNLQTLDLITPLTGTNGIVNLMPFMVELDLYEDGLPTTNANKVYQIAPLKIEKDAITKTPVKDNAFHERLDSSILSSLIDNPDIIKINPILNEC